MNIEKQLNGSYLISTMTGDGYLVKQVYYGYTLKEAKALFLKHCADLIVQDLIQRN